MAPVSCALGRLARIKLLEMPELVPVQPIFRQHHQDAEPIHHAAAEIDGGGFREVARHDRHLLKGQVAGHALGDDFGIENDPNDPWYVMLYYPVSRSKKEGSMLK